MAVVVGCVCAWVFLAFVFGGDSASDADGGDPVWASLIFSVVLWGPPAVLWAVYLALSNRNRGVVVLGEEIAVVDWRGRRRVAARRDIRSVARYHMVFPNTEGADHFDTVVIMAFGPGEPPLLIWGERWERGTLERLWAALGVTPVEANDWKAPVTVREVGAQNADLDLPWPWRRPWATAAAVAVGFSAYVAAVIVAFVLTVPT